MDAPVTSNLGFLNHVRYTFYDNKPMLLVEQTVAQSIPNTTATTFTFTTVVVDNYAGYASPSYTVKVAGWYRVYGTVHYVSNITGSRWVRASINSVGSSATIVGTAPPTGVCSCPMGTLVLLQVGDTIKLEGSQTSGGALSTQVGSGYNSWFGLEYIRCP